MLHLIGTIFVGMGIILFGLAAFVAILTKADIASILHQMRQTRYDDDKFGDLYNKVVILFMMIAAVEVFTGMMLGTYFTVLFLR